MRRENGECPQYSRRTPLWVQHSGPNNRGRQRVHPWCVSLPLVVRPLRPRCSTATDVAQAQFTAATVCSRGLKVSTVEPWLRSVQLFQGGTRVMFNFRTFRRMMSCRKWKLHKSRKRKGWHRARDGT